VIFRGHLVSFQMFNGVDLEFPIPKDQSIGPTIYIYFIFFEILLNVVIDSLFF
jgi:hypothetical protein